MNRRQLSGIFPTLALAALLALGGCKQSGTPQAGNQPAGNPSSAPGAATSSAPTSSGAASSSYEAQQPAAGAAPAQAAVDIPAGTRLQVSLNQELGSKISQPGESFSATVTDDVVVNGMQVIAHGARAEGKVIDAKPLGHFKGGARLALRLQQVKTTAGSYPVSTNTIERTLKGKGKRSAGFIGGGAGVGALIGGLAGGGKGAAIGAAAGAGAGTAGAAATGNKQIVMPAGTVLTFRLQRAVRLAE